ncbi:cysteine--tRNA ligase 2, cytoplasmic-like [Papaver somniferum]|uniref:cysteine--tRNA ligase 2, cytoplasmic-like n=1 Tax=Papaver somniferum TaxID=3469 RepID=UPI000E6F4E5C|nr:cysteine--tRNA ligase 2, cytoplasmic-like [Papaver somniferum]
MSDLNVLVPTEQPRVSENIVEIKNMIAEILQNDYAYAADGDVYFSVDKFPAYGRLSGQKLEDNLAGGGGRTQDSLTSRKQNENDFALWKAAKPGEISWESPWGPGRPGWHIECSAMSDRYLTSSFDIHGGGLDLIFPHHENELAQSCAARPNTCEIIYWMHNGFVNVNKEKMSKSLGNFFTIREVTTSYHPLALRYFMMSTHYRSPVNYSLNQLEIASDTVFYLYQLEAQECINKLKNDFYAKMSDDLHTQDFLKGALQEILKLMNSSLNKLKKAKQQQQSLFLSLAGMEKEVKMVLDTLGLMSSLSYSERFWNN